MRLLLTVLGAQRSTLADRSTRIFEESGGTFGRSATCDWVLSDERNLLSARHGRISHNGRGFLITDTSTNGVYLNAVDAPLGRGQSAPLANGDTIYAADYIISVAILDDEPRAAAFASLPAPAVAPAPTPAAPAQPMHATLPAAATPATVTIPAAFDLARAPAGDVGATPPSQMRSSPRPSAPAIAQPLAIPDDFDFSDLGGPQAVPSKPLPPAELPMPAIAAPASPPPPEPPPAEPAASPLDALALLRQRAQARAAAMDLTPQPGQSEPVAAPARTLPTVALPNTQTNHELGDAGAFWAALGIDAARIPAEARDRLLAELGGALRESARGLVAILSARRSMKDEFRVDQTRLAPKENNPFKFFASGDEALDRVLVGGIPGFLPLDFAVKQCFSDIQSHEFALTSAMQSGVRNLLERIAPQTLESEGETGLLGRRPDKSRLWERYGELHASLAGDLDRTIRDLVSDEFARAASPAAQGSPR